MAVSFIGESNLIATNGGAPGAITPHASSATDDLLVFFHYSRATGGNETVTPPSGFTTAFNSVTANQGLVCVAYRQYTSGTFTATITNHTSGTSGETVLEWVETYRGHDSASPIVNFTASLSTWASSLNIGSITAPSTATVNDGDMVVVFGGRFENITGQTVLSGDNLTWANRTTNNTNLGSDAGAVTQNGLNSSGSNQTVTAKTITTTGTAQVGAGRMFVIEKASLTNYTMPASQSSFSETGQTSTLLATRKILSDYFPMSETGQSVNVLATRKITIDYTSLSESGQTVILYKSIPMSAVVKNLSVSGQDVLFGRTNIISVEYVGFTHSGVSATLTYTYPQNRYVCDRYQRAFINHRDEPRLFLSQTRRYIKN